MLTSPTTPTHAANMATPSSRFHCIIVTLLLLAGIGVFTPGEAQAQKPKKAAAEPAPDPKQVELEQKLADEQAARQAAEAKLAQPEKKVQAAQAQLQAPSNVPAA